MSNVLARTIVDKVIGHLEGLGGFDHWWEGDVDADIQSEILNALTRVVAAELPPVARPKLQIVRTDDGVSFHLNGKCLDETGPDRNPCYAAESIAKELARALGADVENADEPDQQSYTYRLAWHAGGRYGSCWQTRPTPIEDADSEDEARRSVTKATGITAPIVLLSIEYIDGPY